MTTQPQPTSPTQPTRNTDALFRAPLWAALGIAGAVLVLIVAAVIAKAIIDVTGGRGGAYVAMAILVVFVFSAILVALTFRSLAAMYERPQAPPPQIVATEETVILQVPNMMRIDGKPTQNGWRDLKLRGVKPDEARRMMDWLRDGGAASRRAVMDGAHVSQGTYERVMAALAEAGVAVNNGRNGGWTLTDRLDELESRLG